MRTGYPVILAMLLVVTSFAITLAYSHSLLGRIDDQVLSISEDKVPRFERISVTRRELLLITTLADSYIASSESRDDAARRQVDASVDRLRQGLSAYRSLPPVAAEQLLLGSIEHDIGVLQEAVGRALDDADVGARDAAMETLSHSVLPIALHMDQSFEQLRRVSENSVKLSTEDILGVRRYALAMATMLGLLSLAMAIVATALVLQGLGTRARLVADRDRLLTERASELESFAGRVAHDLRDPLNAVGLRLAAMSQGGNLDAQQLASLERASQQVAHMRGVIAGLLDFARSGAVPDQEAHADLAQVLDEVVAATRPAAEAAATELRVIPFPGVMLAIAPQALNSVLSNLLGNAVKYVVEGQELPHRIAAHVSVRDAVARIEVEDNGPGLPPGSEQWIFEPFHRLSTGQPGTGLGLATVRRIVEAYRGRVGVIAELGKGSVFWVELPVTDAAPSTPNGPV